MQSSRVCFLNWEVKNLCFATTIITATVVCRNDYFTGEKTLTVQLNITNEKWRAPLADPESLEFLNVAERVENAVSFCFGLST